MPNNPFKQVLRIVTAVILAFGLTVSFQSLLAAWTAPTAAPPANNISQPVYTDPGGNQTIASGNLDILGGNLSSQNIGAINFFAKGASNGQGRMIMLLSGSDQYEWYPRTTGLHLYNRGVDGGGGGNAGYKLSVLNNGNVGIGLTAPTAKLEVNGQIKITGGAPGAGKVLTSDAAGLAAWKNPAAFSEADTLATVTGRGNTTADNLVVNGTNLNHEANNFFYINSAAGLQLRINSDGSGAANFQVNNSANNTLLTVMNAGNVGIGVAAPANKLEVSGKIVGTDICTAGGICLSAAGSCSNDPINLTDNITYTNASGHKLIVVAYNVTNMAEGHYLYGYVNGSIVAQMNVSNASTRPTITFVVPNGATYMVHDNDHNSATGQAWEICN